MTTPVEATLLSRRFVISRQSAPAANTAASRARTGPSSRGSAIRCCRAGRTSATTAGPASRSCWRRTSGSASLYLLKESFGQLWSYQTEGWARAFFDRWQEGLKWQRLVPYRKFAKMIDRHWDGIASYCRPENKVSLGLVEGLNNKIRVLQRRACGYRDEELPQLKIVAAFLPPLPCSDYHDS